MAVQNIENSHDMRAALRARPALRAAAAAAAGLLAAAAIAALVMMRMAAADRERALVVWQARLAAVAESQARAVALWVEQKFVPLRGLAENASLQIYLTALGAPDGAADPAAAAQRQYLAILLSHTAARDGFAEAPRPPAAVANVEPLGHAGLALVDKERRPLLATGAMPPVAGEIAKRLDALPRGERSLIDLFPLGDGTKVIGFVEPIFRVDAGPGPDTLAGYVLGIVPASSGLFAPLAMPPPHPPSEKSMLVRIDGSGIDYLAAGTGGPTPGQMSRATPGLDAAFAANQPGAFAEKVDDRGTPVLVTGRRVAGTPWTLVHTVAVEDALGEAEARTVRNGGLLLLGTALAVIAVVAAWRHGASRRLAALSKEYAALAGRYAREQQRLRTIVDTQTDAILILDAGRRVQFANRAFGERAGVAPEFAEQKRLEDLLGPASAAPIVAATVRCRAEQREIAETRSEEIGGARRTVQSICVALQAPDAPGFLVVEHDITAAIDGRERHERMLNSLVAALIATIDRRDPYAAQQSAKVAALSRAVAQELELEPSLVAAAELAGRLMNIGKLLVAPELLTREGPLKGDEREQVRRAMAATVQILASVAFEGPVLEALRDAGERWDGSGPRGLAGPRIPLVAQIIAAANLFVAAAAPRAYRKSGGIERAVAELQAQSGTAFDRRVVTALCHLIDNRNGAALIEDIAAA